MIHVLLIFAVIAIPHDISQAKIQDADSEPKLARILKKAGDYCHRLEKAALDYVCLECVEEVTIHRKLERSNQGYTTLVNREKNSFLYDYQMIRKNSRVKENRTLIEKNGKKYRIENAELETEFIRFANEIFGPIGLLSLQRQSLHNYRILGFEDSDQGPVVIIEAIHKNPTRRDSLCGKIWVREDCFDIIRIEWYQTSLGNFSAIQKYAEEHHEEPLITVISDFSVEKNGLKFPSRTSTEMAYVDKEGKKDVRARITVTYTNYKFFTVETEVEY